MLQELERQAVNLPVELLAFYDNKRRTVGEKRNSLLREAQGQFIVFLDDDDRIVEDYLPTLIATIEQCPDADCIVYDQLCQWPNRPPLLCKYGLEFDYSQTKELWTGKPAHTMPWRRTLVNEVWFTDKTLGEDMEWVARAASLANKQVRIDRVMYYYDFDPSTSQTRGRSRRRNRPTPRRGKPEAALAVPLSVHIVSRPRVEASVVISTRNKPAALGSTLGSIFNQTPAFNYEVIVVDDGSEGDATYKLCKSHESQGRFIRYTKLENSTYRNPGIARNHGYKLATGEVLISQSDDVIHSCPDTLERLRRLELGTFNIATVYNAKVRDREVIRRLECYTGPTNRRPLFFLGSLLREHCYAIGGNCEEFTEPGYEDDWFGKCLMHGLGLRPVFREDITAYHQDHHRPPLQHHYARMGALFDAKYAAASAGAAQWIGSMAWPYATGVACPVAEEAL